MPLNKLKPYEKGYLYMLQNQARTIKIMKERYKKLDEENARLRAERVVDENGDERCGHCGQVLGGDSC
jgi:uncharacterized C2H2 Zn-finger protein